MKQSIILLILSVFLSYTACNDKKTKFKTTETGIEYLFIEKFEDGKKPEFSDALYIDAKYYWKDSLLFDSREMGVEFKIPYLEPKYDGSIDEAFSLFNEGDSAIIRINAISFFKNSSNGRIPDYLEVGDMLEFRIRLIKVLTEEEIAIEEKELAEKQKQEEMELLNDYLKKENINVEPTESGLYFIETQQGTGKQAEAGKTVEVHYTGSLLNGQVFDSSVERNEPFSFKLGVGQVIPGWDEGIALMKVGGKATLVIPSELGYGARGAGGAIPPNSTLIFDVELIEVK